MNTLARSPSAHKRIVLYRGPSLLNGRRIVVVATGIGRASRNEKTGRMIQVWILVDNRNTPYNNVQSGKDEAVCGNCPLRKKLCYVQTDKAPTAVYRAILASAYVHFDPVKHAHLFKCRKVRLGAYGDPAAVPLHVWEQVCSLADGHTGYTHQWRTCDQELRHYCMASCDTESDRALAQMMGWRTFRVRAQEAPLLPGEFTCPASQEAGKRLNCERCLACQGVTNSSQAASPSIIVHGAPNRVSRFALTVLSI